MSYASTPIQITDLPTTIIFNGPPRSGKDFLAGRLFNVYSDFAVAAKFSTVLKGVVISALGKANSDWMDMENSKDKIIPELGKSFRDLQIHLFQYLAGVYGEGVLGRSLVSIAKELHKVADRAGQPKPVIFVSDGGRVPEIEVFADFIGRKNCLIIQLYRDGTSFEGDIRNYVHIPGVKTVQFYNELEGDASVAKLDDSIVYPWLLEIGKIREQ